MQFRNPETGEVFNTIKEALRVFCDGRPCGSPGEGICPVEKRRLDYKKTGKAVPYHCDDFAEAHPTEAAHLIGCEIVPAPHLAEVLGLVAEQRFAVETDEGVSGYYHLDCCPHTTDKPITSFLLTQAEAEEYSAWQGEDYYTYDIASCPVTAVQDTPMNREPWHAPAEAGE